MSEPARSPSAESETTVNVELFPMTPENLDQMKADLLALLARLTLLDSRPIQGAGIDVDALYADHQILAVRVQALTAYPHVSPINLLENPVKEAHFL